MRINIPKFAKGAAASSTLTIVGVCLIVVVAAVPIIAVSFSAMALWKSPESIPAGSGSGLSYDSNGTPMGSGNLVKNCPALNTLSTSSTGTAKTIANYPKWVDIINTAAEGKSASPALVMAILWHENGDYIPDTTGDTDKCKKRKCDHNWPISSSNAYGPFQFLNNTWYGYGLTTSEKSALDTANVDHHKGTPAISDTMFDPARAAKGAAAYLGASMDAETSPVLRDKIEAAIFAYNHDKVVYVPAVYAAYEKFTTCLESPGGVGDVPPAGQSKPELVVWWAQHEQKLNSSKSSKPPRGFHTENGENKVKYMNLDVNNVTSVAYGESKDLGWCMAFATWVYQKAGYNIRDIKPSIFASPVGIRDWFSNKANGHTFILQSELQNVAPKDLAKKILKGDIIIMRSNGSKSGYHAGIVTGVDAEGRIHTIEGNVGGERISDRGVYGINQPLGGGPSLRIVGFARW